jgi:hypothetical protein
VNETGKQAIMDKLNQFRKWGNLYEFAIF